MKLRYGLVVSLNVHVATLHHANFGKYFDLVLLFKKNSPLRELFVYEPMTNFPEVFASTPNRIPIFWVNITNACQSE